MGPASVCVAEKSPVRRCLGRRWMMAFRVFMKPMDRGLHSSTTQLNLSRF